MIKSRCVLQGQRDRLERVRSSPMFSASWSNDRHEIAGN
jgi:hypothetical protein